MKRITILLVLPICLLALSTWGCAPQASYATADSLKRTSNIAGNAAVSSRQAAGQTQASGAKMQKDIQSIKEAERLFDEKSGIILSY